VVATTLPGETTTTLASGTTTTTGFTNLPFTGLDARVGWLAGGLFVIGGLMVAATRNEEEEL